MTKLGMSVDDWVRALRTIPIYAILSGFEPGAIRRASAPFMTSSGGSKITDKLVSRALREAKIHYTPKEHDLLQQLFQTMFVLPSAAKGLLGDTHGFRVIGDSSPVETGARSFGKFLCDCRKSGIWK
ncbi:hypothetical protein [Paenibacillus popilliae]|nr:hypothetical protein [Paenibacillus popilliae]